MSSVSENNFLRQNSSASSMNIEENLLDETRLIVASFMDLPYGSEGNAASPMTTKSDSGLDALVVPQANLSKRKRSYSPSKMNVLPQLREDSVLNDERIFFKYVQPFINVESNGTQDNVGISRTVEVTEANINERFNRKRSSVYDADDEMESLSSARNSRESDDLRPDFLKLTNILSQKTDTTDPPHTSWTIPTITLVNSQHDETDNMPRSVHSPTDGSQSDWLAQSGMENYMTSSRKGSTVVIQNKADVEEVLSKIVLILRNYAKVINEKDVTLKMENAITTLPLSSEVSYDEFSSAASDVIGEHSGWEQIAMLLMFSQIARSRNPISHIVDYATKYIADKMAEFIYEQGGWNSLYDSTDGSRCSSIDTISSIDIQKLPANHLTASSSLSTDNENNVNVSNHPKQTLVNSMTSYLNIVPDCISSDSDDDNDGGNINASFVQRDSSSPVYYNNKIVPSGIPLDDESSHPSQRLPADDLAMTWLDVVIIDHKFKLGMGFLVFCLGLATASVLAVRYAIKR